jgi:hypothetical protein
MFFEFQAQNKFWVVKLCEKTISQDSFQKKKLNPLASKNHFFCDFSVASSIIPTVYFFKRNKLPHTVHDLLLNVPA